MHKTSHPVIFCHFRRYFHIKRGRIVRGRARVVISLWPRWHLAPVWREFVSVIKRSLVFAAYRSLQWRTCQGQHITTLNYNRQIDTERFSASVCTENHVRSMVLQFSHSQRHPARSAGVKQGEQITTTIAVTELHRMLLSYTERPHIWTHRAQVYIGLIPVKIHMWPNAYRCC